jgi:hypothetical protein
MVNFLWVIELMDDVKGESLEQLFFPLDKRKQIIKKLSINESEACEKYLDTKGYDSYVVLKNDINIYSLYVRLEVKLLKSYK